MSTVVVVDDDPEVRDTTAAVLRASDHRVIEAADGVEGLERLSQEPVDVILLDLAMPRLGGRGVLEALDHSPPIIVVSAFASDVDVRQRFGSKVVAFLQKPVSPQRLLTVVANAVRGDLD